MAKYIIKNTNILHNGRLCKIGEVIELDEKTAVKLADILTPVKETETKTTAKVTSKKKTTKAETEVVDEIVNEAKQEGDDKNGK